jgi:hypothetical protein
MISTKQLKKDLIEITNHVLYMVKNYCQRFAARRGFSVLRLRQKNLA